MRLGFAFAKRTQTRKKRSSEICSHPAADLALPSMLSLILISLLAASSVQAQSQTAATAAAPQAAAAPAVAPPDEFTAKVYDLKNSKDLLFIYKHASHATDAGHISTNTYTDPSGQILATESTETVKDGDHERLKSYKMSQKQLQAEGSVEVQDGTAHFKYERDGKTKTASEKFSDDFVVGPTLVSYLARNWSTITSGKTVKARFVVLDRLETVGFQYFKEKEEDVSGQKTVVVKMKPSSVFISALVDPLHFYLTPDGHRLIELDGRTQIKRQDGSKWKDLDGITRYEY